MSAACASVIVIGDMSLLVGVSSQELDGQERVEADSELKETCA